MKPRSLIHTNPYLKNPATRQRLLERSIRTSGGVEGIKSTSMAKAAHIVIPRRKNKRLDEQSTK
jgi:hypothetical protein